MGILRRLMGMFTDQMLGRNSSTTYRGREVRPASEDPYGDPADQMGTGRMGMGKMSMGRGGMGNVKPASMDPYGDPADQMPRASMGTPHRKPSSNVDPYGDPGKMGWRR